MIRIPKFLEIAACVAVPCIIVACLPPEEPAHVAPVETTSVTSTTVAPAPQPVVVQTQPAPRPTSTTVIVNTLPPPPPPATVITMP